MLVGLSGVAPKTAVGASQDINMSHQTKRGACPDLNTPRESTGPVHHARGCRCMGGVGQFSLLKPSAEFQFYLACFRPGKLLTPPVHAIFH